MSRSKKTLLWHTFPFYNQISLLIWSLVQHLTFCFKHIIWAWSRQNQSFGASDKARLKTASFATGTSWKIVISPVTNLHMILSNRWITKALIRQRGRAGWSEPLLVAKLERQIFSRRGPFVINISLDSFFNFVVFFFFFKTYLNADKQFLYCFINHH